MNHISKSNNIHMKTKIDLQFNYVSIEKALPELRIIDVGFKNRIFPIKYLKYRIWWQVVHFPSIS